jgi:hypothetical protein
MMARLLLAIALLAASAPPAEAGCFLFLCSRGMHVSRHRHYVRQHHRVRVVTTYRVIVREPPPKTFKHIYW